MAFIFSIRAPCYEIIIGRIVPQQLHKQYGLAFNATNKYQGFFEHHLLPLKVLPN
jgi:hypothetical protein